MGSRILLSLLKDWTFSFVQGRSVILGSNAGGARDVEGPGDVGSWSNLVGGAGSGVLLLHSSSTMKV